MNLDCAVFRDQAFDKRCEVLHVRAKDDRFARYDRLHWILSTVSGQTFSNEHNGRYTVPTLKFTGSIHKHAIRFRLAMIQRFASELDLQRQSLELRPDFAHAYNALGYTFADRNIRLKEAYELIDKAMQLAPDDGFILDSMGWVQYRMGNLAAARDFLKRAYKLKPEADVAAHLGEVMWTQGERDAARNLWREASRRESGNETLKETLQRLDVKP